MNKRDLRPKVKQITKQWVRENCKNITKRDLGLLQLLYENKRKLLKRSQIEILYPEFASTDRLNKRLKALYKLHVIDRIYPPVGLGAGSSQQHICLDRAGIILLGLDRYNKPIITDTEGNKTLPLGWEHKVKINDYECDIIRLIKVLGGEIKLYEVEKPLYFRDTKIIPDIMCLLKCNNKGYLFFIEVDLGTEDIPYIKSKLDNYTNYYLSKEWTKEPWARCFKTPAFPRILFLTENVGKRISTLEKHTNDSSLRFIYGGHEDFKKIFLNILNN